MKIDNSRANLETVAAQQAYAAETRDSKGAERARPSATADQVSLSTGVHLAKTAAVAAGRTPDVRPEVVARAKALLASGEVGNDPGRLADVLIDRALGRDE